MKKYLYEVRIKDGRSNKNWQQWYQNVDRLGAIKTDHGGIKELCALSSNHDTKTVWMLCTQDFTSEQARKEVEVTEITKATLSEPSHAHSSYQNVVNHFKPKGTPKGTYPNLR